MATPTIDIKHSEWARAGEFCTKHFGNSVTALGYEGHVARALVAGENVTLALEELADEDCLDYRDGGWGHLKPDLSAEHSRFTPTD